jgi:hypothetical protein
MDKRTLIEMRRLAGITSKYPENTLDEGKWSASEKDLIKALPKWNTPSSHSLDGGFSANDAWNKANGFPSAEVWKELRAASHHLFGMFKEKLTKAHIKKWIEMRGGVTEAACVVGK